MTRRRTSRVLAESGYCSGLSSRWRRLRFRRTGSPSTCYVVYMRGRGSEPGRVFGGQMPELKLEEKVKTEKSTVNEVVRANPRGGEYLCCSCVIAYRKAHRARKHAKTHLPETLFEKNGEYRELADVPDEALPDRWLVIPRMSSWIHPEQVKGRMRNIERRLRAADEPLSLSEIQAQVPFLKEEVQRCLQELHEEGRVAEQDGQYRAFVNPGSEA